MSHDTLGRMDRAGSAPPAGATTPARPEPTDAKPDPTGASAGGRVAQADAGTLSATLDSSPTAVAVYTGSDRVLENRAFRRLLESTTNGSGWQLVSSESAVNAPASLPQIVARVVAASRPKDHEEFPAIHRVRRIGDNRDFEIQVVAPPDPSDRGATSPTAPRCYVWITDVADRSALRASLDAAQAWIEQHERLRNIGELSAGLVHDIHNTLGAIGLRIGLLRRDPACMATQQRNIEALDRIVTEGNALISKLQRLGRTDLGEQLVPTDLTQVISEAIEIAQSGLKVKAAETGVHVEMETDLPALPTVSGTPEELTQLFVNLLLNARDAMPNGGKVVVRAECTDVAVIVRVEDEGTGIPPAVLPHVFDAFFTTKGSGGTGMGLAMARRAMDRIGGRIEAANRSGGGASFTLSFPR